MNIIKYKLEDKNGYGVDEMSSTGIKITAHGIIERLTHIINYSFHKGYFLLREGRCYNTHF